MRMCCARTWDSRPAAQAAALSGGMALRQSATAVLPRELSSTWAAEALPTGPLNERSERHWGVSHDLRLPQTPHDLQQKTQHMQSQTTLSPAHVMTVPDWQCLHG